jgi:hypothetical protein
MFLYNCANAIWSLKRSKGLYLFILIIFLSKYFNHIAKDSILSWAIVIGLPASKLPPFQHKPPITMADLLQAIDF